MSKQAGEIARQAAKLIRDRGWCQNRFSDPLGRVCMRGAFTEVSGGYAGNAEREFTLWMNDVVGLPLIDNRFRNAGRALLKYDLARWNDAKDRTREEILAYLDKFAEEQDPQPVLDI